MIINRRILRELKSNLFRYLAIFFLIALSMCIVVGFAGSSESILGTVDKANKKNCVEDGAFSLYIPLQDEDISAFKKMGVQVEASFYVDITLDDNSRLRVFKNRSNINLVDAQQGEIATKEDQILLEKNYAKKNEYKIGDSIKLLGKEYIISGVGSAPDYNFVKENIADILIDTKKFSIAFVSEVEFENICKRTDKIEHNYSYRIDSNSSTTPDDIKNYLLDITFSVDKISDEYYLELQEKINSEKEDYSSGVKALSDGVNELSDGCKELSDGVNELGDGVDKIYDGCKELNKSVKKYKESISEFEKNVKLLDTNSDEIMKASSNIFNALLLNTQTNLSSFGINVELTQENYKKKLSALSIKLSDNVEYQKKIETMLTQLNSYGQFQEGLTSYTSGVSQISEVTAKMTTSTKSLAEGVKKLKDALAELNERSSTDLVDGINELTNGVDEFADGVDDYNKELDKKLEELYQVDYANISYFVDGVDNPRLNDYKEDSMINRNAAIAVGIILIALIAYILSVFIYNNIERESAIIGTLYAQGYVKHELFLHYMVLPVILAVLGAIIGTITGFNLQGAFAAENIQYYSYPDLVIEYKPYLIIYGIAIPILMVIIINMLVISKKLSLAPLTLLRKEKKSSKVNNVNLHNMGFINRYRIRQILRELRTNIAMFFGLFISILLLVFSVCIYCSLDRYSSKISDDINYNFMYSLKYPLAEKPDNVQEGIMTSLGCFCEISGTDLNVSLLGIDEDNPYFDFDLNQRKDEIVISNSVALKFGYKVGDMIILSDQNEEKNYVYEVSSIIDYSNGLFVFMNIEDMKEQLNLKDGYYNVLFSDKEIEVPESRLMTVTTKEDIEKVADSFVDLISTLIIVLLSLSVILFVLVMYILMKVMIERSVFSISLIKIFGFNEKEVKKLYLGSNFYMVALSAAFSIPISKMILNKLYPILVANLSSGMLTYISPIGYVAIVLVIFMAYFVVNLLLSRNLKKVSFTETLKSRE